MNKMKDENLIAFNVSKTMGWSVPFGRLYTLYRIHSGMSHADALNMSLSSPIIGERDKPIDQNLIFTDLFEKEFS